MRLRTLLLDEDSNGSDDDDFVRMKQTPTSCLKRPTQGFSTRMHYDIRSACAMTLTLNLLSCHEAFIPKEQSSFVAEAISRPWYVHCGRIPEHSSPFSVHLDLSFEKEDNSQASAAASRDRRALKTLNQHRGKDAPPPLIDLLRRWNALEP